MSKFLALLDLLRKGSAVTDPKLWKDRAALTLALTGLIVVIVKVAKGFGYDLPINETDAGSIAAGFAVLIGLFSTYATSDKVGLLPAKPVQPDGFPPLDSHQPAAAERRPAEPFNAERGS